MRSGLLGLATHLGLAASLYIDYSSSIASVGVDGAQITINFGQHKPCEDEMMNAGLMSGPDMMGGPDMSAMATVAQYDRGILAATTWNTTRSFLTYVHSSGQAMAKQFDAKVGWSGWTSMGGNFDRTLAVTQFNDNVYTVGVDVYGSLLLKSHNGTAYFPKTNGWMYLGGGYIGTPAISSLTNKTVDVIVKRRDGSFDHINYNPIDDRIVGPSSLGGNFSGYPALVYANMTQSGALHVFGIDAETSQMWYKNTTGPSWLNSWVSLGGDSFASSPTAVSLGSRIDVLAHNKNGTFSSKMKMDAQEWSNKWMNGGSAGTTTSSPTAFWWTKGGQPLLEVWYSSTTLQQARYSPSGWISYLPVGELVTNPVPLAWADSAIQLWGVGKTGTVYIRSWSKAWGSWTFFGDGAKVA